MPGRHSYKTDLRNPGVYVIVRDDKDEMTLASLEPLPAMALRRICEVLDQEVPA